MLWIHRASSQDSHVYTEVRLGETEGHVHPAVWPKCESWPMQNYTLHWTCKTVDCRVSYTPRFGRTESTCRQRECSRARRNGLWLQLCQACVFVLATEMVLPSAVRAKIQSNVPVDGKRLFRCAGHLSPPKGFPFYVRVRRRHAYNVLQSHFSHVRTRSFSKLSFRLEMGWDDL